MPKITMALMGAGNRGKDSYAKIIYKEKLNAEFIAVIDPDQAKRQDMIDRHGIDTSMCFDNEDDFFAQGKLCDVLLIGTQG